MTSRFFQTKEYFHWLCSHIQIPDTGRLYDGILTIMYMREFVWVIGNDENRIEDARDLRVSYLKSLHIPRDHEEMREDPISFLEVLIGLSSRVAFMVNEEATVWAWKLIENLGLHRMYDQLDERQVDRIHDRLDAVIFRTYDVDGTGGFFPLVQPNDDQTQVELWYQMSAYVEENRASYGL